jgi:hypothetical protein
MSNGNCPNCGTCLCTGHTLTRSLDGTICCTNCLKKANDEVREYLALNPGMTIDTLKRLKKLNR